MDRKLPKDGVVLFSLVMLYLKGCGCSGFSDYVDLTSFEIIIPQKLSGLHEREASSDGFPEEHVSYVIPVDGKEYTVHLEKETDFLGDNYTIYTTSKDGGMQSRKPDIRESCQYKGYVAGIPNSEAIMGVCSGQLSGIMYTEKTSYEVVPLWSSSTFQHVIYDVKYVLEKPLSCGLPDSNIKEDDNLEDYVFTWPHYQEEDGTGGNPSESADSTEIDLSDLGQFQTVGDYQFPKTYIEIFTVVDNERYVKLQSDESAVKADVENIFILTNGIFTSLNAQLILTGLEVWTGTQPVSTGFKGSYPSFLGYTKKQLSRRQKFDLAALFQGSPMSNSKVGVASKGTVCASNAVAIASMPGTAPTRYAATFAHEIGHVLNMDHDEKDKCVCKAKGSCAMAPRAGPHKGFSSCSQSTYKTTLQGKSCLKNPPRANARFSAPVCGNNIVDAGEECDCGNAQECENDPCCTFGTCVLRPGSQCGFGQCCENCQFLPTGTVCRANISFCDLPEYCDGLSPYCPVDVYKGDGTDCMSNTAYCYQGNCFTNEQQCKDWYGSGATAASTECFEALNSRTDVFGHCGVMDGNYTSCTNRSVMCGKLQCNNVGPYTDTGITPAVVSLPVGNIVCSGIETVEESDVPNTGMVVDGTVCGIDKVCLNTMCIPLVEKSLCDNQLTCNDHGVCNNKGNCHCDVGWSPPKCNIQGRGGSIDSGPTYNDSSSNLKTILLVVFLVGIPVLIICGVLFVKRNTLRRVCGGQQSSHTYMSDEHRQSSSRNAKTRSGKGGVQQTAQPSNARPPSPQISVQKKPSPSRLTTAPQV